MGIQRNASMGEREVAPIFGMTSSPAVTWCVINHNGAEHLEQAFQALKNQSWQFAEILLVDNGSDDDSLRVASLFSGIKVIQLRKNQGPGAARNAGFTAAKYDLILFQDNDIRLGKNTTRQLVELLLSKPDSFAVAPRVVYADDPETIQFDSADCHFLGLMATRNADMPTNRVDARQCETSSLVTACFLLNRRLWRENTLFDESLGFNLEDHDFAVRARLAGYSLWIEPKAIVQHGSGTPTLSYRPGRAPSAQRLFYLTLNRWIVIRKCFSTRTIVILSPALLVFELLQLTWLTTHGQLGTWRRAVQGLARIWKSLGRTRQQIHRERRVGDNEILQDAPLPFTRYVRDQPLARWIIGFADRVLRGYWHLVRRWI